MTTVENNVDKGYRSQLESQKNSYKVDVSKFCIKSIIKKKRDGQSLTNDEVEYFVKSVTNKSLDKEQIGALLMAIWLRGMTVSEMTQLTFSMVHSGITLTWPEQWKGTLADKHSTGGVGDKISLVLTPALAACQIKVPMISGRALGHTGGTLDKLEAIPNFSVSQSPNQIVNILDKVGCCIVGQTEEIVPADRILYSTRDITSTVDSVPLIVSSIVSKKAAENLSALVLDVKFGTAAFMKEKDMAHKLASDMVRVSNGLGIKTTAVLTSMDAPVGYAVGNALEVLESLRCLHGEGPHDLEELVLTQGALLLRSLDRVKDLDQGRSKIHEVIHNGKALEKFEDMLICQGVSSDHAKKLCTREREFDVMTAARHVTNIQAQSEGYVHGIEPLLIAGVSAGLGGARKSHDDRINHSVGVMLRCHIGVKVNNGDVIASVHHDQPSLPSNFYNDVLRAVHIQPNQAPQLNRIEQIIS